MQTRLQKIFLWMVVLNFVIAAVWGQTKLTATISPVTIGKNETAELKLMVENAGSIQQISPPLLNNFIIVSGPNQESGMESMNGNTKRYTGITYLLKPKAKGNYVIGSATATADNKVLQSNPVKLKVIDGATGNSAGSGFSFSRMLPFDAPQAEPTYNDFILRKGESVQDKISKNIFIKVDADKTSCYVGEPLVATYKLYTRLKSVSNIVKSPSFNGFSVIDLVQPGNNQYTVEKLNGREYNVYTLRKVQLYPLQAGSMELEAASVENDVRFMKEEYIKNNRVSDLYGDYLTANLPPEATVNEKIMIQNKPVSITVKPLPEVNKPAMFNGAVGNFTIRAETEKNYITTDDAGILKITVSGQGNLTLVNAPEPVWPAGVEAFDPVVKDELNTLSVPVSGNKTFEYAFNITKAGTYSLPSVEYSFFDPATGKYQTAGTRAFTINVAKGSGKKMALPAVADSTVRENISNALFTNRSLIIAPVALLIITGLLFWIKADRRKQQQAVKADDLSEKNELAEQPQNPLAKTEEAFVAGDAAVFFATLNNELCRFAAHKLNISPEMMSRKNISDWLDKAGVPFEKSKDLQGLMEEISQQLYMPSAGESQLQHYYERALAAVRELNMIMV